MNSYKLIIISGSDDYSYRTKYELELPLKKSGFPSKYFCFYFGSFLKEIINPIRFIRKIFNLFIVTDRKKTIYLINNTNYLASFITIIFSKIFNCPIVMRVRGRHEKEYVEVINELYKKKLFLKSLIFRFHFFVYKSFLLPRVFHFLLISKWCEKEFNCKDNYTILYNCIDLDRFKIQNYTNGEYILAITDFRFRSKIAGLDLFFTKYSDFIISNNLKFKIAGSGFLLNDFKKKHSKIKSIEYLGKVKDVCGLFNRASVFIHFSLFDAYPTTILEAMSIGVPVLTNNCCGMLEQVVDGHSGFLLNLNNKTETENKIISLLNSTKLRKLFIKNAHISVNRNNSPVLMGKKLKMILDDVCKSYYFK